MLADISVNSVLDETELDLEKKVVLGRDAAQRGQPAALSRPAAFTAWCSAVIPTDARSSGRPRSSRRSRAIRCSPSIRRYYVPESFAGSSRRSPWTPTETLRAAERSLGRLRRSGSSGCPPRRLPASRRESRHAGPGALATWGVGWLTGRSSTMPTPRPVRSARLDLGNPARPVSAVARERLALVNSVGSDDGRAGGRRRDHGDGAARAVESRPREAEILKEVQRVPRARCDRRGAPGERSRWPRATTPSE